MRYRLGKAGDAEYEGSRFFGDPVVPESWADEEPWPEDCWFMCQLNLGELDSEGLLPASGYLYLFVDASFDIPEIRAYYSAEEPDTIYGDCNRGFDEVEWDIHTDYPIEFGDGPEGCFAAEARGDDVIIMSLDPQAAGIRMFEGYRSVRAVIARSALSRMDLRAVRTELS